MNIRFDGKVVLITGASTGIGAAVARGFGAAGASVVVHYNRSVAEAHRVAHDVQSLGGRALLVQGDVTDRSQIAPVVDATLKEFGTIDILINNAGALVKRVSTADISDDLYDEVMSLNVDSVFQFCKRVIPTMRQRGHGNIINVTSISARHGGGGGSVIYSASKGAVSTMTRGLAKELAWDNIRVNAISPGVILTPFHERYTDPERMKQMVEAIPMKRAGQAEECVGTVLFLASDEMSSYITGQVIEINGGQIMP